MKLHLNSADGMNSITGHGSGYVMVNQNCYSEALIVMADKVIAPWPVGHCESLDLSDFAAIMELKPELVLFGSGATFCFPDARIMAAFSSARIGFEVMDTPAACRTYNVLMSEGRNIAAAILI